MNTISLYTKALNYERSQALLLKQISPPLTFSTNHVKGVPIPVIEPYTVDYAMINHLEELIKKSLLRSEGLEGYLERYKPQLEMLKANKHNLEYADIIDDLIEEFPQLDDYFYKDEQE